MLHDHELVEIRGDTEAGYARELADMEIGRRARLSAHEKLREMIGRGPAC